MTPLGTTCFSSSPVFSGVLPPGRPLNRCDERCPAKTRVGLPSQVGAAVSIRLRLFLSRLLFWEGCGLWWSVRSPQLSILPVSRGCFFIFGSLPSGTGQPACLSSFCVPCLSGTESISRLWCVAKQTLPCVVRAGESEEGGRAVSEKVSAENCETVMDILLFCPWRQRTVARDALHSP